MIMVLFVVVVVGALWGLRTHRQLEARRQTLRFWLQQAIHGYALFGAHQDGCVTQYDERCTCGLSSLLYNLRSEYDDSGR